MNHLRAIKNVTLAGLAALLLAGCMQQTPSGLKDMSSEGYGWAFFQAAKGTAHDRELTFLVDKRGPFNGFNFNVLEGTYFNTGTEAPEHLRDPSGRMIFAQDEERRYFDVIDNARNDVTRISLFDPPTRQFNSAFMSRYATEWWGDSDFRAISVNGGPVSIRLSGVTNHFGVKTQEVMASVFLRKGEDYLWMLDPGNDPATGNLDEATKRIIAGQISKNDFSWLFNQDYATFARNVLTGTAKQLENNKFRPPTLDVLMSTADRDGLLDFMGIESAAAQGELFNGEAQYVISSTYNGPNNKIAGGLWGHEGAPDKYNKLGKSLDTVVISLGSTAQNPSNWQPKAEIIVYHPNWSNQTEYRFNRINPDGSRTLMGATQRTYNNKTLSITDSQGKRIELEKKGTNSYLLKGDIDFMASVMVLMGGQQIPLGFDYKTSYLDYALDLIRIAHGVAGTGAHPGLVGSLNVNADSTIGLVIHAGRLILGVEPPLRFQELLREQQEANREHHLRFLDSPAAGSYGTAK